eukprot:NODE_128_length_18581_cov_0.247538.p7 type:complete len:154 gc:universal NODE_128_length_18581_cov_0.247538:8599-9060(+)
MLLFKVLLAVAIYPTGNEEISKIGVQITIGSQLAEKLKNDCSTYLYGYSEPSSDQNSKTIYFAKKMELTYQDGEDITFTLILPLGTQNITLDILNNGHEYFVSSKPTHSVYQESVVFTLADMKTEDCKKPSEREKELQNRVTKRSEIFVVEEA